MKELFNIDQNTLQKIVWYHDDLNKLLPIINQLAIDNFDNGYSKGYSDGCLFGWSDCDSLAKHFFDVTSLDIDEVIDLYNSWLDDSFDNILNTADEIAQAKYDLGFNDSNDRGSYVHYSILDEN